MAIIGVENAIFGVDDVKLCTKFWDDFGLVPVSITDTESVFEVASGSKVTVMHRDDPRLPAAYAHAQGIRETIWGVDTQESFDKLIADLSSDRELTIDESGTAHFCADDGMPLGLRLWHKREVVSCPDPVNAPGNIQRLNQHRKWRMRAIPKTINHVVFFSKDYVSSFDFFRDRLGFRLTDHSKGVGVFARADGTYEHHSIFWVNTALPVAPDEPGFMHIAFGVEDIDEIMLGANLMTEKGWENTSPNTSGGLSRHRITSALYYYVENPGGGEAEYHADTDYLDDNWIPRAWDWKFGSLLWAHSVPAFFQSDNPNMEMILDPDGASLEEFRGDKAQLVGAAQAAKQ
ncbi:MAG: bleomycin resistance protein [SAR86 cluster bacterium]|uniref:Bleomycin resistance protein n=1 Tax=SAR86 cluster bacterium TaxID=2030880 RepID=A0A2A5C7F0_9GAMM|nr:VOC family protein [Gammaproteobacteria bacterium AH-315-E17]PCJ39799.1 MAG: bleomycin resistance protein [SAR86 cluster bacterium]